MHCNVGMIMICSKNIVNEYVELTQLHGRTKLVIQDSSAPKRFEQGETYYIKFEGPIHIEEFQNQLQEWRDAREG